MEDIELQEKAVYLKIALAMQNINAPTNSAQQLTETFYKIIEKGGKFDVYDAIEIQIKYEELAKKRQEDEYKKL